MNGDANTKFFHVIATSCKQRNRVTRLKRDDGEWCEKGRGMEESMMNYFMDLFKSNEGDSSVVFQMVENHVSNVQNELLLQPFTNKEINEALDGMQMDKSPALDGFNPTFYQRYYH